MADSKVETLSGLAQWRIDNRGSEKLECDYCGYYTSGYNTSFPRKSDPFKMGIWNWHLQLDRREDWRDHLLVRLFLESAEICKQQLPFARFVMRVTIPAPHPKVFTSQVYERQFRTCEDFGWPVDCAVNERFIIDVEFVDLKICPLNGGEVSSVRLGEGSRTSLSLMMQNMVRHVSRMFKENIHFDLTINTPEGSLRAHKAFLCACSSVFQRMFHHDLQEKESSTINIKDISLESFTALLSYLYGTIKQEDFLKHRLTLVNIADKYDIVELKDACEESLLEDICSNNVLERLQAASLHQLDKLKKGCLIFLFEFGKIYDVCEEMDDFFRIADEELKLEIFKASLGKQMEN